MKIFSTLFICFFISQLAKSQPASRTLTELSKAPKGCYHRETLIKNPILLDTLTKYLRVIEPYELPIMAVVITGDTTALYLSAIMSGNAVKNCPPSYLTTISGRQVAIYTGSESVIGLDTTCLNELVSYCREFLHVDLVNVREGVPPGTMQYYNYNPFRIRLLLIKNELISVDNKYSNEKPFPFFKSSF